MVGERRILPRGWVDYSASPTPGAFVGYGAGFWTNRDDSFGAQNRIKHGMPRDAFMASGQFGQFVVVVPSERLVVARFGVTGGMNDVEGVSRLVADGHRRRPKPIRKVSGGSAPPDINLLQPAATPTSGDGVTPSSSRNGAALSMRPVIFFGSPVTRM